MIPALTVDGLLSLKEWPCWSEDQLRAAFGAREEVELSEALASNALNHDEAQWLFDTWLEERGGELGRRSLRWYACWNAWQVLALYERAYPGDDRPRRAIVVAQRYSRGRASEEELEAAGSAAGSARSAAWAAARSAAGSARSAAWAAARSVRSAARSARSAAWAAEEAAEAAQRRMMVRIARRLEARRVVTRDES